MATPKLALIPTGYKAGKLYSVLPESGVGDFTVVRATEATRVNEEGLIETMAANVPRLDYSGGGCPVLLTEPQSTNLVTYSEAFDNSYWNKSGASVTGGFASPSGDLSAFKLVEDTSTGTHRIIRSSITVSNNSTISNSIFVKKGGRDFVRLSSYDGTSGFYAYFDLNNGVIGTVGTDTTATITEMSNGWYKCTTTFTIVGTNLLYELYACEIDNNVIYTGDGTSGIYIWGAQLEQSSFPTSLIKTEGSAVTRNVDQVNGAGDAATFNDSEGVLMAEISALADDDTNRYISISDGSTSNRVVLRFTVNNEISGFVVSGTTQAIFSYDVDILNKNKVVLKWKQNDFALWVNGIEIGTDTSGVPPINLNLLRFEDAVNNGQNFYGNTSQLQYFNTALTDSELETLTSWTSFIEMAQAQNYNII